MAGDGEILGLLDEEHECALLPPVLPALLSRHVLQRQDEVPSRVQHRLVLRGLRL